MRCPEKWTISYDEEKPPDHLHWCKFGINDDHQVHVCKKCGKIKPSIR